MPRILGRTKDHRTSLLKNLGYSLVLTGRISTTLAKAKEARSLAEQWVTQAKAVAGATGPERLRLERLLRSQVQNAPALKVLLTDIAARSAGRTGGYTRLYRTGVRVGDSAPRALVVWTDMPPAEVAAKKSGRTVVTAKSATQRKSS